jgi:probable DNA repair protein
MGAGDLTWPGKHSYSPLLPWGMQKELGMPGELDADGERNHKLALRISGSASSVVFSYANESSSGTQRLSSTVALLNPLAASLEVLAPGIPDRVSVALEEYFDITPLPATPDAPIHGGAEILRLQAACGFRAFTERRLFATELKNITLGMDYMERGTIVHSALEFFWRDIRSQENLLSMTADERGLAVDRAVDESIQRLRQQTVENWEAAYIEVQRGRLRSLISNWLDVEMNRQPFEVAQSEKEFKNVPIGPLQLTVRVDRVDHTESGDVIIDYKTGSASPADWLTDRPDAPQLPLYAVISSALHPENELADIAFSKVHAGNDAIFDSYEGKVTAEKWGPNKKRPAITSQLEDWRSVLVGLAEDFHLGDARVDPKLYPNTCKYCALRTFCRLDPAAIEIDEEMNDQSEID